MRFSPNFLDEVRARVPVSSVVGRKVRLKKEGREWRGLSPFSSEKTPSFFVNDQKQRWFDFSAGKNGNIFDFVMETEGLTFPEAVERLAGEAGLALPVVSREEVAREAQRATVIEAMDLAAGFFEAQLRGRGGEAARAYLAGRGISPETQATFRIGLASRERFALRDYLAGKNVARETMIEGGLLVHGEGIEVPYDRFRDRIMFPICDRSGRVIAFGGRALDPGIAGDVAAKTSLPQQQRHHVAKYLNSPETPLFHKGSVLFNHHRARRAAHESGRVIAVEGYVDAIAMTAAGFSDVVAPLGTALTADQCALLWQMAPEPILCFDGDAAGRKAAWRAIDTAMPLIGEGRTLRFALLPDGLDPDDLARTGGHDALERVIAGARSLVEMVFAREVATGPLDTPERRFALERRLRDVAGAIADGGLRRHYEEDLARRAAEAFGHRAGRGGWRGAGGRAAPGMKPTVRSGPLVSEALSRSSLFAGAAGITPREAFILAVLLDRPHLVGLFEEEIAALTFAAPDLERMRAALLTLAGEEDATQQHLDAALERQGLVGVAERVLRMAGAARLPATTTPLDAEASLRQALGLQRRGVTLHTQIVKAQAEFAMHPDERNERRLVDLRTQLSDFGSLVGSSEDEPGLPTSSGWG